MPEKFFICDKYKVEEVPREIFMSRLNGQKDAFLEFENAQNTGYAVLFKDCVHRGSMDMLKTKPTGLVVSFSKEKRPAGEIGTIVGFLEEGEQFLLEKKCTGNVITGVKRKDNELVLY
jgi:hypothetical protein